MSHAEWIADESDLPDPKRLLQPEGKLCLSGDFGWRQEVPYGRRLSECTLRDFDAWTSAYVVVPEKSSRSRYLLDEMRRRGGYTLPETQGVWVKTLQNRNGFHAA